MVGFPAAADKAVAPDADKLTLLAKLSRAGAESLVVPGEYPEL